CSSQGVLDSVLLHPEPGRDRPFAQAHPVRIVLSGAVDEAGAALLEVRDRAEHGARRTLAVLHEAGRVDDALLAVDDRLAAVHALAADRGRMLDSVGVVADAGRPRLPEPAEPRLL